MWLASLEGPRHNRTLGWERCGWLASKVEAQHEVSSSPFGRRQREDFLTIFAGEMSGRFLCGTSTALPNDFLAPEAERWRGQSPLKLIAHINQLFMSVFLSQQINK